MNHFTVNHILKSFILALVFSTSHAQTVPDLDQQLRDMLRPLQLPSSLSFYKFLYDRASHGATDELFNETYYFTCLFNVS